MLLFQFVILFICMFFFLAHFWSVRIDDEGKIELSMLEIWYFRFALPFFLIVSGKSLMDLLPYFLNFPFPKIIESELNTKRFYEVLITFSPLLLLLIAIFFFCFTFIYTLYWVRWLFLDANKTNTKHKMFSKNYLIFNLSVSLLIMVLVSPFGLVRSMQDLFTILVAASLYKVLTKKRQ